jgi:putative oxidoreductase
MITRLLETDRSPILLFQRCLLGLVIFPHGAQKLLGWYGGYGFGGTMGFFTGTLHMPAALAFLVIMVESLGAIAMIAGALTRIAAFGIAAVMVGAILMVHAPVGFFMNWFGQQGGEGFEYHLLVLALSLPLALKGGGLWALDTTLLAKLPQHAGSSQPVAGAV